VKYAEVEGPDGKRSIAGLLTTDGVSTAIRSEQVVRSIVMFGLLYLLLGSLWVYLLHSKIAHGPEPVAGQPHVPEGFLDVAAEHFDAKLAPGRPENQTAPEIR
jgi:hypothetical protein